MFVIFKRIAAIVAFVVRNFITAVVVVHPELVRTTTKVAAAAAAAALSDATRMASVSCGKQ